MSVRWNRCPTPIGQVGAIEDFADDGSGVPIGTIRHSMRESCSCAYVSTCPDVRIGICTSISLHLGLRLFIPLGGNISTYFTEMVAKNILNDGATWPRHLEDGAPRIGLRLGLPSELYFKVPYVVRSTLNLLPKTVVCVYPNVYTRSTSPWPPCRSLSLEFVIEGRRFY